jgi:hypothetical protein
MTVVYLSEFELDREYGYAPNTSIPPILAASTGNTRNAIILAACKQASPYGKLRKDVGAVPSEMSPRIICCMAVTSVHSCPAVRSAKKVSGKGSLDW